MGQTHCGVRGVDALSAVSGRTHHIDTDVLLIDHNINILIHLRHNGNADGGGMDSSAALRLGYALHAVYAALILHLGVSALPAYGKLHFLHTADADLIHIDELHAPTLALRIMHIHAVDLCGKKSCLITARARADLHDHVLIIIGILGEQQDLQLLLQLLHPLLGFGELLLQHFPHFLIALALQHGEGILDILLTFLVFGVCLHKRRKIALLLHQLAETFLIVYHIRLMELVHHLFISSQQII